MVKRKHDSSVRYISQSLLLEEKSNPLIHQVLISFFVFLILLFVVWASFMEVDEVTVAPGKIIPIEDIHRIQHLDGGMIKKVFVKNGDFVKRGDRLIELDGERLMATMRQNRSKLDALVRKHRYIREQVRIRSKLYKRGLNSKMSFLSLQAEESELKGEIKETTELINGLKIQISELTVKSPANGIVHGFSNRATHSIIGASELIMEIVPRHRQLVAEVQISASEIGHVKRGQKVTLKFNTYDFGKYGGSVQTISDISPMTQLDPKTGTPFYKGSVVLSRNFIGNTSKYIILPGMTLVAEIKTGKKTVMEYLLKPVFASAQSALREK